MLAQEANPLSSTRIALSSALMKLLRPALVSFTFTFLTYSVYCSYGQEAAPASAAKTTDKKVEAGAAAARLSHGKKLMLKDGNFQLARSYERNGERVRYFSLERGDWEEIPAALVDWDATAKAQAADEKADAALVQRLQAQEKARQLVSVVDVDASLPVGQGVFLPTGEGMFVVTGKLITKLEQVGSQMKSDKARAIGQVISPIPIVTGKRNLEIPGPKAKIRVDTTNGPPEFYLREPAFDPDTESTIRRSSRQGTEGPEVELVRATVKGGKRRLEAIHSLMGQDLSSDKKTILIQRWEVARDVYRFTIGEPLPPGEYALAEVLPGGINLFVWDFGIDSVAGQVKR
jgi:hypothetical protein